MNAVWDEYKQAFRQNMNIDKALELNDDNKILYTIFAVQSINEREHQFIDMPTRRQRLN